MMQHAALVPWRAARQLPYDNNGDMAFIEPCTLCLLDGT